MESRGSRAFLIFVLFLLAAAITAGCVPDGHYAVLQDSCRRAENRGREYLKSIAALKMKIESFEQEKKALRLEIARRDEALDTYRSHLEWARFIPGAEVSGEGNLILKGDIIFRPGSHELTAQGKATLDDVARVLTGESGNISTVRIDGHTDNMPIRKTRDKYDSNMQLSFLRAYHVYKFLEEHSRLDPAKLHIAAFGEHRPRSEDSAENRRVEILVLPEEK